ncbi:MAG: hypothetical protein E4H33_05330 [Anaerolineales bacterium]|nr:MAG: hypothetical protein E4H33_05330 [Anaerolineales bacterium]
MIIKPIQTQKEISEVARVEAETWGMKIGTTLPDHVLTAIACNGGLLLGAYIDRELVGFTLGWLGTRDANLLRAASERLKLVSHMTGVLSGYRDQRIGYHLKLAQRQWAIDQGLDLVTWTYDPLESRNSFFNIHLLACTCQTYFREYYGEMIDEMNQGIPSDRFRVDWWITSPVVEQRVKQGAQSGDSQQTCDELIRAGVQLLNPARRNVFDFPLPPSQSNKISGHKLLIEIPAEFQIIRQKDPALALSWRYHVRELFESVFREGFEVRDFIYQRNGIPRSFYLLEKNP